MPKLRSRVGSVVLRGLLVFCGPMLTDCDPPMQPTVETPPKLAPDEIPLQISLRCPGDSPCIDDGDGVLYAGFAKRDLTPLIEPFTDA